MYLSGLIFILRRFSSKNISALSQDFSRLLHKLHLIIYPKSLSELVTAVLKGKHTQIFTYLTISRRRRGDYKPRVMEPNLLVKISVLKKF